MTDPHPDERARLVALVDDASAAVISATYYGFPNHYLVAVRRKRNVLAALTAFDAAHPSPDART